MNKTRYWIVTGEIGGLTYSFRMYGTHMQCVFAIRNKYPTITNISLEPSFFHHD